MKGLLSVIVMVSITALAGLSIFPGPVRGLHTAGLGTHVVLVPAGDDNSGGH